MSKSSSASEGRRSRGLDFPDSSLRLADPLPRSRASRLTRYSLPKSSSAFDKT